MILLPLFEEKRPIRCSDHPWSRESSWLLNSVAKTIIFTLKYLNKGLQAWGIWYLEREPWKILSKWAFKEFKISLPRMELFCFVTSLYKSTDKNNAHKIPNLNSTPFHVQVPLGSKRGKREQRGGEWNAHSLCPIYKQLHLLHME